MTLQLRDDERLIRNGTCALLDSSARHHGHLYLTDKRIVCVLADFGEPIEVALKKISDQFFAMRYEPPTETFVVRVPGKEYRFSVNSPDDWQRSLAFRLSIFQPLPTDAEQAHYTGRQKRW